MPDFWELFITNRNGVDVQLWGQPSVPARSTETLRWPRIALRVKGNPELQHWVLLEDPVFDPPGPPPTPRALHTESVEQPPPLTTAQQAAVRALFRDLLAWPPRTTAVPMQLKQVAHRLQISREAVQRRLEDARRKAVALGLSRSVPLTDPEYMYVLVRAGYLQPSDHDLDPPLSAGLGTQ